MVEANITLHDAEHVKTAGRQIVFIGGRAKRIEIAGSHFVVRPGGAAEQERGEHNCKSGHRSIHPGNFERSIRRDDRNKRAFENEDFLVSHPHFRKRPIRSVTGKVQDVVGAEIPA